MERDFESWDLKKLQDEIINVRLTDLKKEYDLCMVLSEKAKLCNDWYALAFSYTFIADYYLASKNNKQCIIYLERARKLCESRHYTELLARIYNFSGMYYNSIYDEIKALEFYLKSLDASEKCDNKILMSSAYNNIATCFDMKHNYVEATNYYEKGYFLLKTMNMDTGYSQAVLLTNLCNCDYKLKRTDELQRHLDYFKELKETSFVEGMKLLYLYCQLMHQRFQKRSSMNAAMERILKEQEEVENRLLVYQVLKNVCSIMLEVDEQTYTWKLLEILIDIEGDEDIRSRRELQKLIVNYYEKFGTEKEQLKAYQEFYNIVLTIEDIDMEDNSAGISAAMELYRTREKQMSLEKENEQLEKLMNTDEVTNISNRRCFNNDIADPELNKQTSIAVAMLDIDYFKEYNDIYGHQMGDQALIEVGKSMNTYCEDGSIQFYRYGGDEFSVIFINQSEERVRSVLEALCKDIKQKNILHEGSKTDTILTLSCGYAVGTPSDINMNMLIRKADEQLYRVKQARKRA